MKIKTLMCALVVGVSGLVPESVMANEAHADHQKNDYKLQTTCPVMGKPINKKFFVDKDGERIYVCCGGCVGTVKKSFDKYEKKLNAKGQKAYKVTDGKVVDDNDGHSGHNH